MKCECCGWNFYDRRYVIGGKVICPECYHRNQVKLDKFGSEIQEEKTPLSASKEQEGQATFGNQKP